MTVGCTKAASRGRRGFACRRWVICFLVLLGLYPPGIYLAARLHDHRYPPSITNSLSFDAKLQFLRGNRQIFAARTVVIGSSMGLNNLDSAYLERVLPAQGPYVNLASWGIQMDEIGYLLDFFLEHAPNVRNVILVGQAVDFEQSRKQEFFDRDQVWSYICGNDPFWFELRHFDVFKAYKNWRSYDRLNRSRARYEGLDFDSSGAVLLDIPESRRNAQRWNSYGLGLSVKPEALHDLERLCAELKQKGKRCMLVVPPVRPAYQEHPESVAAYQSFKARVREIATGNGAGFLDADQALALQDDCFIDMMHLNREGAKRVAQLLVPLL